MYYPATCISIARERNTETLFPTTRTVSFVDSRRRKRILFEYFRTEESEEIQSMFRYPRIFVDSLSPLRYSSDMCIHHRHLTCSIRNGLAGAKNFMRQYEKTSMMLSVTRSLPFLFASQFTVVNIETEDSEVLEDKLDGDNEQDEYVHEQQPTILNSVQKACNDSLNATVDFLNVTFDAISQSALQYKNSLNDLYSCLEKYESAKQFTDALEELADAVIGARAKVFDCEREYLELVTVMQSIEKVTKAISELSFLMREEALALILSETLHSVRESIELDSTEIKDIKKKFYKFENSIFSSADINTSNVEIITGNTAT